MDFTRDQEKDAIEVLIQKYGDLTTKKRKDFNEANTANAFIRPLFEALGWDFTNLDEIEAEKTIDKRQKRWYLFA